MTRLALVLSAVFLGLSAQTAQALPAGAVDGVFASTTSNKAAVAGAGFNAVTVNPYTADLNAIASSGLSGDRLAAGLRQRHMHVLEAG